MPLGLFGITNSGLNLFVNLVILFLIVLWIALIAWTYLDARRRISDPVLIACATAASLFPYVGTIVYAILRPPEFLDDARERDLEMRSSELRVRQLQEQSCPNCGFPIERNYLRCPSCRVRVKDPCESCGKPIDPRWSLCPYCETPVRRAEQAQQQRRARPAGERPTRRTPAERVGSSRPASRPSGERSQRKPAERPTRASSGQRSSAPRPSSGDSRGDSGKPRSQPRSSGAGRSSRRDPSSGRPSPAPDS
jgi:Double zinc ribbon